MRLLIANDDGIYSPGIAALAEVPRNSGTFVLWLPILSDRRPDTPSLPLCRFRISERRSKVLKHIASMARRQIASRWEPITGKR